MNITVNAQNSPYQIQGGTVNYGTVTIQAGGYLQLQQQTQLNITTLTISPSS
jgi:hypothetical protein